MQYVTELTCNTSPSDKLKGTYLSEDPTYLFTDYASATYPYLVSKATLLGVKNSYIYQIYWIIHAASRRIA